ncbi:MLO-like protein [Forsythia ovata]|uniref:MLO-like protein n=1 Tax=Forsythia ovata TaxID=205694 RepID=A0ABD1PGQ1_9LAMI
MEKKKVNWEGGKFGQQRRFGKRMTPPPYISASPSSSPHPPASQPQSTYFESISLDSFVPFSLQYINALCSRYTVYFDEHVQVGLVGWAQKVNNKKGLKVASSTSAAQGDSTQDGSTQGSSTLGGIQVAGIGRKETTPSEAPPANNS